MFHFSIFSKQFKYIKVKESIYTLNMQAFKMITVYKLCIIAAWRKL